MSRGGSSTIRRVIGLLIAAVAALAAYDGGTLLFSEAARARHGVVTTAIVVAKIRSPGADGERTIAPRWRRRGPMATQRGFTIHDELARLILTGSPTAWAIDYRYGCELDAGCRGRDFVTETLWQRLSVGQTVNVRRAADEIGAGRLDDNPRRATAIVDVAMAGVLLLVALWCLRRRDAQRANGYMTAPAVVVGVEPVKYRDDVRRWRIRFAYFDREGRRQESADEVLSAAWKPGDDCLAVFPLERPDLAGFRPPHGSY